MSLQLILNNIVELLLEAIGTIDPSILSFAGVSIRMLLVSSVKRMVVEE